MSGGRRHATWRAALITAAVVAVGRPALWAMSLATFLVRGGVVLVAVPIVVLPTVTGVSNVFGQDVAELALGGPGPGTIRLIVFTSVLVIGWLLGGGLIAASIEATAIRTVAAEEEVANLGAADDPHGANDPNGASAAPATSAMAARRILAARLLALVPLAVAFAWAVPGVVAAAYHELILPNDLATPIVVRVVRDVPVALVVLVVVWIVGETIGSVAARAIVLEDRSVLGSLFSAMRLIASRPLTSIATAVLGLAVVIVMATPALIAASIVWSELRIALDLGASVVPVLAGTTLLVGTWTGGLVLVAAASAWRSAAWTVEASRIASRRSLVRVVRRRLQAGHV